MVYPAYTWCPEVLILSSLVMRDLLHGAGKPIAVSLASVRTARPS